MRPADPRSAEQVQFDLLRRASVARRASLTRSLSQTTLLLARRAIREAAPSAGGDEIALRFVATCYGTMLADQVRRYLKARRATERS
jgi:hypothetical protein